MVKTFLLLTFLTAPAWGQDLDGDGHVSFADFLAFTRSYGQTLTLEQRLEGMWTLTEASSTRPPLMVRISGSFAMCSGQAVLAMRVMDAAGGSLLMDYTAIGTATLRGTTLEIADGHKSPVLDIRFDGRRLHMAMPATDTLLTVWERPQRDLSVLR